VIVSPVLSIEAFAFLCKSFVFFAAYLQLLSQLRPDGENEPQSAQGFAKEMLLSKTKGGCC
jgi:hypothetical protein